MFRQEEVPYFHCDEPGTFAELTFKVRLPSIVERLFSDWKETMDTCEDVRVGLTELLKQIREDKLVPLKCYNELKLDLSAKWSSLPFLHVEIYFYFRILEAFGYFNPELPTYGVDVFRKQKEQAYEACKEAMKARLASSEQEDVRSALLCSFWGNKTDLSLHSVSESKIVTRGHEDTILSNDVDQVAQLLLSGECSQGDVDIVLDNYCFELFNDLLLARHLLKHGLCRRVMLHCKKHPQFVSDAVAADVEKLVRELDMWSLHEEGRLQWSGNAYWNGHYEWFHQMPNDLKNAFEKSHLTLVKGDANYRKLVGERKYSPDTAFSLLTKYFPARALCAMRGIKCDLVCGIPLDVCKREEQANVNWRTDGMRGVIQYRLK